jgi:hypothetical protein
VAVEAAVSVFADGCRFSDTVSGSAVAVIAAFAVLTAACSRTPGIPVSPPEGESGSGCPAPVPAAVSLCIAERDSCVSERADLGGRIAAALAVSIVSGGVISSIVLASGSAGAAGCGAAKAPLTAGGCGLGSGEGGAVAAIGAAASPVAAIGAAASPVAAIGAAAAPVAAIGAAAAPVAAIGAAAAPVAAIGAGAAPVAGIAALCGDDPGSVTEASGIGTAVFTAVGMLCMESTASFRTLSSRGTAFCAESGVPKGYAVSGLAAARV